jgi:hypothetical protein
MNTQRVALALIAPLAVALLAVPATAQQPNARSAAPVDLTGTWVSVVTEDWAWRMQTPLKGDYASVPLNDEGRRVADVWSEEQDGSCLGFGAASMLRVPTRVQISWLDDNTLRLETDNGDQTRLLHFNATAAAERNLQGHSVAEWQTNDASQLHKGGDWGSLKVVTTQMQAAWLRPNGVPYSEHAVLTEYFDRFADGETQWFAVTIIVEDPTYLTEPFVISSNFKREPNRSKWNPVACGS